MLNVALYNNDRIEFRERQAFDTVSCSSVAAKPSDISDRRPVVARRVIGKCSEGDWPSVQPVPIERAARLAAVTTNVYTPRS
jgi:hypothetical protein